MTTEAHRPENQSVCDACRDGDHANCGLQSWCKCQDERDGDPDALPDHGPACPCNACVNALIAENDDD